MKHVTALAVLFVLAASCGTVDAQHPRLRATVAHQYVDGRSPDGAIYDGAFEENQDYYPLKVGNTWTYSGAGGKFTSKIVAHENVSGVRCAKLETFVGGNSVGFEHIGITADGIYRFSLNGMKPDKPVLILKLPAHKGAEWKIDTKIGNETVVGKMKITEETVTVPAGKFKALVAGGKMEANGQALDISNYFVKGVGVAKIKMEIAGQMIEVELEKFEPGK